jgi:hypothetical protein
MNDATATRRELRLIATELLRRLVVALEQEDLDTARELWAVLLRSVDTALAANDARN